MRRIYLLVLVCLYAATSYAQAPASPLTPNANATGNLTASGATCATTNACVTVHLAPGVPSVAVTITGTWSATMVVEMAADNGVTWVSAGTAPSANGQTVYTLTAQTDFRVRLSAYTSGTVGVFINVSTPTIVNVGTVLGGNGVGAGASPIVGWYFGPNCPIANTGQCFNTSANTQVDNTCSWTNASTTVTCTDAPFVAGDAIPANTKLAWGYSSTSFSGEGCNPYIPQPAANYITLTHLNIASVTDSSHVVLNGTPATSSLNATSCLIWGTTDDAGATALEAAYDVATSCPKVTLQAGNYLFTTTHFNSQPNACKNLPEILNVNDLIFANTFGNVFFGVGLELEGRGIGPTHWFIPPDFPETGACTFGIGGNACFHVPGEGYFHDFAITAGSARGGLPTNKSLIEVDIGTLAFFTCTNVGGSVSGTAGVEIGPQAQLQQVNLSACGADNFLIDSNTGNATPGPIYTWPDAKGYRLSSDNAHHGNFRLKNGGKFRCQSCISFGTLDTGAGLAQFINEGGELWLEDGSAVELIATTPATSYQALTNAGSILHAHHIVFGRGSSAVPTNGIACSVTCTNYLQDSYIVAAGASNTGWLSDVAGSNTYDLGGLIITPGTPTIAGLFHHRETGTCTFAASTTCVVTFTYSFGSSAPSFFVPPNIVGAATTLTVSALSATSATITASASNSSAVNWEAVLQ